MTKKRNNPETIAIHGGDYRSDPATNAVAVPIYRTTSYQFKSVDHAANLFALKEFGNIYTRIMNPTNDVLEKRLAALEGGLACLTVASGQTASLFSVLNVAQAGDNIVSSTDLYKAHTGFRHARPPRSGLKYQRKNDERRQHRSANPSPTRLEKRRVLRSRGS